MIRKNWLFVLALWIAISSPALADMRITFQSEHGNYEMFMKDGRIMSPLDHEGGRMIVDCRMAEVIFVGSAQDRRYWQGTPAELAAAVDEAFEQLLSPLAEIPGMGGFLDQLFGEALTPSAPVQVRVREMGKTEVNGYDTVHYRVETNSGNGWRVHEELWLSPALMNEVQEEVGDCITLAMDMDRQLSALIPSGMEEHRAVMEEPAYVALLEKGFPVRTHSYMEVFGMAMEETSDVVNVSRSSLSRELFLIPEGYTRVTQALEMIEY